jgi:uncharacterized protein YecA (UPF0149 family)
MQESSYADGTTIREIFEGSEEERIKRACKAIRGGAISVTQRLLGRNDPCVCGSGKKFKRCCLWKYRGVFQKDRQP